MTNEASHPLLDRLIGLHPVSADELLRNCESLCVVSPHPDDETLGCGTLLFEAARRDIVCRVVCMTDGGASHVGSPTWSTTRLAEERRRELLSAVNELTIGASVHTLGYPDGAVPGDGAAYCEAVAELTRLFDEWQPSLVTTTWSGDPHIDHHNTSRIVRAALQIVPRSRCYEYPIWGRFVSDPAPNDFKSAIILDAPDAARRAKHAALSRHRTQMTRLIHDDPDGFVMEEWMQRHFLEHPEIYLAAS